MPKQRAQHSRVAANLGRNGRARPHDGTEFRTNHSSRYERILVLDKSSWKAYVQLSRIAERRLTPLVQRTRARTRNARTLAHSTVDSAPRSCCGPPQRCQACRTVPAASHRAGSTRRGRVPPLRHPAAVRLRPRATRSDPPARLALHGCAGGRRPRRAVARAPVAGMHCERPGRRGDLHAARVSRCVLGSDSSGPTMRRRCSDERSSSARTTPTQSSTTPPSANRHRHRPSPSAFAVGLRRLACIRYCRAVPAPGTLRVPLSSGARSRPDAARVASWRRQ
jgi:hypothetical protein